jgi:hypothetical protein
LEHKPGYAASFYLTRVTPSRDCTAYLRHFS